MNFLIKYIKKICDPTKKQKQTVIKTQIISLGLVDNIILGIYKECKTYNSKTYIQVHAHTIYIICFCVCREGISTALRDLGGQNMSLESGSVKDIRN